MKYGPKGEYILGVTASMRRVVGVLVHETTEGPEIVRTFTRKRAGADFMQGSVGSDVEFDAGDGSTFQLGGSGTDAALFLDSEFKEADLKPDEQAASEFTGAVPTVVPFEMELLDIVTECENAGYPNPRIAFTLLSDHLFSVSVDAATDDVTTDGKRRSKKKKRGGFTTEQLIELIPEEDAGRIEADKATFLPMHVNKPGDSTHLGVFAHVLDPVHVSLGAIRDRKRAFPYVNLLDTEFTLLYGLVRASRFVTESDPVQSEGPEGISEPIQEVVDGLEDETTLLIRVGPDDTIVMFMVGEELLHFETLRSITAFDPPETICSRILLLQDELGTGDAHRLVIFSDDREEALIQSLNDFFPETRIEPLRKVLPVIREERTRPLGKESIMAAAAALRLVKDPLYAQAFHEVDFLNPKLKGRSRQLPFSWSVAAMIVVLFCTTLFFVSRYFVQNRELDQTRFKMEMYPQDVVDASAESLQHKIDSLQALSTGYVEALDLLDSMLVGSDRWSRALEKTAINTAQIEGIWIDQWREEDGRLMLIGSATQRDQIVDFARSIGGVIGQQTFSSIRDVPVYSFSMTVLMKDVLPEAALYLRKAAREAPVELSELASQEPIQESTGT